MGIITTVKPHALFYNKDSLSHLLELPNKLVNIVCRPPINSVQNQIIEHT